MHLSPVCDLFERAVRGEEVFACVSVPPQHGKTETVLHAIAWWLSRRPEDLLIFGTYSGGYARSRSRTARDYARAAGVELRDDSTAVNEWRTPQGGGLLASGAGGIFTGFGAKLAVIDDPHKNRAEAESSVYRSKILDWFRSSVITRIHPGGSIIIVHTRWHEGDLIGTQLKSEDPKWEVINLPAINDGSDPRRKIGEPLWPEGRPLDFLRKKEKLLGPYEWSSLYQGQPRPRGGTVFGDVYFYTDAPKLGFRVAIGIDLAYTKKKSADYSVAVVMVECGGRYYVIEVVRLQVRAPEFSKTIRALQSRYRGASTVAYVGGTERGVIDMMAELDDGGASIDATTAADDKFIRAQPVAAAWNDGKVLLPSDASWLSEFVSEVCSFTGLGDPHDDQVDALAAAYDALKVSDIQFPDEQYDAWLPRTTR